jgi:hypothetical protein
LVLLVQRALLDPATVNSSYDFARDHYPSFQWLHARYAAHQGVFWDQSSGMGNPLFDLGASAYFYFPLRFRLAHFNAVPAVALCLVLHFFIAASGAYFLARSQKASASASFVAAVAVAFSGGMTDVSSSLGLLIPLAWFPWMILGLVMVQDAARRDPAQGSDVRGPALRGAAVLGLATGLSFLCSHIGMAMCQVYVLAVLYLAYVCINSGRLRRLRSSLPALLAAALIAALLFSGQALALHRLMAQAGRSEAYSEAEAAAGAMNPVTLGQMFLPHLLGQLKDATFLGQSWRFGTNDPQGIALYCGVLAFVLALYYLGAFPWRAILPWAAGWLFLVLYALGNWTPLFHCFYYCLPVLGHLHWAVRAACQAGPLLCVPLASGLDRLRLRSETWPARLALALGAALLAFGLALRAADPMIQAAGRAFVQRHIVGQALHAYPASFYIDKLSRWLAGMRLHVAEQGLWALATGLVLALMVRAKTETRRSALVVALGLLLFAELNANLSGYNPSLPRRVLYTLPASAQKILSLEGPGHAPFRSLEWGLGAQLRRSFPQGRFFGDADGELRNNALLAPNLNKIYGLDLVNSYPSPDFLRMDAFTGWFQDLNMDPPQPSTALLPRRRLFDLSGAKYLVLGEPLAAPGLTPLLSDPVYVYRNATALPLAYVAERYSGGWTLQSAVEALGDTASAQAHWPKPALVEAPDLGEGKGGGSVAWVDYTDLDWQVDATSKGPGVLVLSRLYYPGPWKASVNGRPVPLLAANGALCAVRLKGGLERVRVYYQDSLPAWGLAAQALAWMLAVLCLLAGGLTLP